MDMLTLTDTSPCIGVFFIIKLKWWGGPPRNIAKYMYVNYIHYIYICLDCMGFTGIYREGQLHLECRDNPTDWKSCVLLVKSATPKEVNTLLVNSKRSKDDLRKILPHCKSSSSGFRERKIVWKDRQLWREKKNWRPMKYCSGEEKN